MSKIIIENRTKVPDLEILEMVSQVIRCGRISNNGTQYCYLTVYVHPLGNIQISTDLNKKSDRFVICYDQGKLYGPGINEVINGICS